MLLKISITVVFVKSETAFSKTSFTIRAVIAAIITRIIFLYSLTSYPNETNFDSNDEAAKSPQIIPYALKKSSKSGSGLIRNHIKSGVKHIPVMV